MVAMQPLPAPIVAIGDRQLLARRAAQLNLPLTLQDYRADATAHTPGVLPVIDLAFAEPDCVGQPRAANAVTLLAGLDKAVDGCLDGQFRAMVTAPLQKSIINDAGIAFSGHTEYLAARCKSKLPVMLLACDQMRVALATTHLPLRQVADAITHERISAVLEVLWHGLRSRFGIEAPHIAVCGLNPHAGEGGHLGSEDSEIILPAINEARAFGRNISGPFPADTVFNHAGKDADAVLAMFHDQGLPVIKYAGFGSIVNITLGLPIVRTSVDHGSALDIAGSGKADPASLLAAIESAASLRADP